MSSDSSSSIYDLHLGLPNNVVKLAPYNPTWPLLFEEEKERLSEALVLIPHAIEHIGSTAVPGLNAKPVLDIMLGVSDAEQMILAEAELIALGYDAKGEKGVAGRLFLTCGDPCCFHVHITEMHGAFWEEHILFRDSLRQEVHVATNYVSIKTQLANAYPNDRDSYTRGKADFIEQVIANARQTARTSQI